MKIKILLLSFLIFVLKYNAISQSANDSVYNNRITQDSLNGIYIPQNIEDCFLQIDIFWADSTKELVKSWSENEFIANAHFGFGMWMRNNWGLWGGSRLQVYFNNIGIYHPDDMSGIILTSYHRKLNNKKIELKKQIKYYKSYWKSTNKEGQGVTTKEFIAKTKNDSTYNNIDSALVVLNDIVEIRIIGYKKIPKKILRFKNLNELHLTKCSQLDFEKAFNTIAQFEFLSELYLFENGKYSYPENIGELSQLKKLWIDSDSLIQLPVKINNLVHLNQLLITECLNLNLDSLFQTLASMDSLRELDLSENNLSEIPYSISKLSQLTDLWLDHNELTGISDGIKSLSNLDYLGLFRNKIDSLDFKAVDLPNLTQINLCYNNFNIFPLNLEKLQKLEIVIMWGSEVSIIPDEISKMKYLKRLNLQFNNLSNEQKEKLKIQLPNTQLEF